MERSPSPTGEDNDNEGPILSSLRAPVSPPRRKNRSLSRHSESKRNVSEPENHQEESAPRQLNSSADKQTALIESGKLQVANPLSIFSTRLRACTRPLNLSQIPTPRLSIPSWTNLYQRNQHHQGNHFVVHQHDHPIAGPHYDLRLQFSESSSVSWSIMYGLPGDPNSRRLNRNAVETRVHCFWNHLIETASPDTGSMLIWDTGEYEVLPYRVEEKGPETETEGSGSGSETSDSFLGSKDERSESEKLRNAFRDRKIRLRLHGTQLPKGYTIILRLDKASDFSRPVSLPRKRRRRGTDTRRAKSRRRSTSSPSPSPSVAGTHESHSNDLPTSSGNDSPEDTSSRSAAVSDTETDQQIRMNNAYPGSTNSIGSIHQRRWFITLDRANSGFEPEPSTGSGKKTWVRKRDPRTGELTGFEPFYVRGPDAERSVVTGRLGRDVFEDEGVKGFIGRRGWTPVLN